MVADVANTTAVTVRERYLEMDEELGLDLDM